jgi:hypothetical protein
MADLNATIRKQQRLPLMGAALGVLAVAFALVVVGKLVSHSVDA